VSQLLFLYRYKLKGELSEIIFLTSVLFILH